MLRASFRPSIPRVLLLLFVGELLWRHLTVYRSGAQNRGSVAPRHGALPWEQPFAAGGNVSGGSFGGRWAPVEVPVTSVLTCAGRCGSDILLVNELCSGGSPRGGLPQAMATCRETPCVCDNAACSSPGTSVKCCPDLATACPFEMARTTTVTAAGHHSKPPIAFPPRHHGKERSFVDAVFVHTDAHIAAQVGGGDLVEWLEYMRYAGIGHFIMYDCRS